MGVPGDEATGGGDLTPSHQSAPIPATQWQAPEPHLVTIGQIVVTPSRVITPSGAAPVSGVVWSFQDLSQTTTGIPTWAIVCTIVFVFFFLLGLLFLLAKERRTQGWVQVTVQAPRLLHTEQIPVNSIQQVMDINARVNYARSVSMGASL
jgi:hypothetical protein